LADEDLKSSILSCEASQLASLFLPHHFPATSLAAAGDPWQPAWQAAIARHSAPQIAIPGDLLKRPMCAI